MYTAREAFINHVDAAKATIGFETVKRYQGEIRQLAAAPRELTVVFPAAFVLYDSGGRTGGRGRHRLETLVVTETDALAVDDNADDALQLAEALADWLGANHVWAGSGGESYNVDLAEGVDAETLLQTNRHAIVRLSLTVQQL